MYGSGNTDGIWLGQKSRNQRSGLTMARKVRTFAQEADYTSSSLAPIERRSLIESGMRPATTRFDIAVVLIFLVALVALLGYFVALATS